MNLPDHDNWPQDEAVHMGSLMYLDLHARRLPVRVCIEGAMWAFHYTILNLTENDLMGPSWQEVRDAYYTRPDTKREQEINQR